MNFDLTSIISNITAGIETWVNEYILVQDAIYQLFLIAVIWIIAFLFSAIIKKTAFKQIIEDHSLKAIIKYLIFPFLFFILLIIGKQLGTKLDWKNPLLEIMVNIVAAYFILKIFTIFFKEKLWFKFIRNFILVIFVLNILGLYEVLRKILESITFGYSDNELSVYLILKGFLTLFLALVISLKISELLQKKIDQSKTFDPSLRVLFSKLTKIGVLFVALLFAFNYLGIKLTTFAVLGGALGVGVGFGLQKIVSNLTSGFILLLDKSIRPGDVIEVEDTFGTVKSMSTRYTTIFTRSGKEYFIPNEDLITKQVINWSHSDKLIRIDLQVGVSYDTDITKAIELVKKAANNNPRVNKEKAAAVFINDFADSSINLEARFWIVDPEEGVGNVKGEVRNNIWKLFQENDISIPFPQSEVYIKSLPKKMT